MKMQRRAASRWAVGQSVTAQQAGAFTEFRCKADAAQPVQPGDGGPMSSVDNRCWARTGHSLTQARPAQQL